MAMRIVHPFVKPIHEKGPCWIDDMGNTIRFITSQMITPIRIDITTFVLMRGNNFGKIQKNTTVQIYAIR